MKRPERVAIQVSNDRRKILVKDQDGNPVGKIHTIQLFIGLKETQANLWILGEPDTPLVMFDNLPASFIEEVP